MINKLLYQILMKLFPAFVQG